jgi:hypothetical protein
VTFQGVGSKLGRAGVVALVVYLSTGGLLGSPLAGATTTPSVEISPSAASFTDGVTVKVSVGPNSLFIPYSRIEILECADPGGSTANLPTSGKSCDGNTLPGDSIIVQPDGSFSEATYTLYALPNVVLQENDSLVPRCDPTHACVLYVGEDQNDFTRPKVFSHPFTFTTVAATLAGGNAGASGTTGSTGAATATTGSTSVPTPTSPSADPGIATGSSPVTASPSGAAPGSTAAAASGGVLAFTGPPEVPWLVAVGAVLIGLGLFGRRLARRSEP